MRTVLALLLLAVAANAYTLKSGGLKGSWATGVAVTGPVDDMLAPTISGFTIDDEAADYMFNATETSGGYVYFDFDSTDAGYSHTCTLSSAMWNEDMTETIAELYTDYNSYLLSRYLPQGEYVTTVSCTDFTGNSAWWDSATSASLYSIQYANHAVDTTPFVVSNLQVDGDTGAISYAITDTVASDTYALTFDYEYDEADVLYDSSPVWGGSFSGSWTAVGSSTEQMTWDASCYSGTCTAYIAVSIDSEPGVFSITSGTVWDQAGNMATVTVSPAILITITESDHSQTVVSCQTLVLEDATDIPDVTSTSDYFGVVLGCTIKDDVLAATAYIYYIKQQLVQMGANDVFTFEDGGVMASNANDYTSLSILDGTLSTDIDIAYGSPAGPYALQSVTTRTSYGQSQLYTLDLGSASSAAPSVAALLVAAAVALLRL
jgi:hypothetical protein